MLMFSIDITFCLHLFEHFVFPCIQLENTYEIHVFMYVSVFSYIDISRHIDIQH